ncbi:MAG: ergothioneine biosynthesis protein EgtB [Longimicrobiales bacterium]
MPAALTPPAAAELLADARARTLLLIAPVSEEDLRRQHDPLMGPILWDLGHIAHFEKLWLIDNLRGPPPPGGGRFRVRFGEMPGTFNPFENPRRVRGQLELPALGEVIDLLADARRNVFEVLGNADLDGGSPLLCDGYVYRMVAQHEYQHGETMLQTLQLKQGSPYSPPRAAPVPVPRMTFGPGAMVRFPGGRVETGTFDRRAAYDNERPRHTVEVAPFDIDVAPVTNAEVLAFMRAGGYQRRELWSDAGWAWLGEAGAEAPKYWVRDGDDWRARCMDRVFDVDTPTPVCHVCYHEAEAYARFAGKRLPTEIEWEAAASWDPASETKHDYPWGDDEPGPLHANLDQLTFSTAPIGAYPLNVSPIGCYGMIGDVWEWTSSDFNGYPDYESFPYPEYSEPFFGPEHKVLRGGSWATRPGAIRNTFRNWDYPIRRQIFSGFRCARDA